MAKILKNTTGSAIEIDSLGVTIDASSSFEVEPPYFILLGNDDSISELTPLINSGDIVVNDGIQDITESEGINFIQYPDEISNIRIDNPGVQDLGSISVGTSVDAKTAILEAAKLSRVSSDDTTYGYLEDNIIGNPGIDVNVLNPGGDEQLQVDPDTENMPTDVTGTGLVSTEVGPAIRELYDLSQDSSRSLVFCSYNGNANTGRYLEFFNNISSDTAPVYVSGPIEILTIVSETSASTATCTIGWYDISGSPVLLHTTTFSSDKRVIENGSTIFTLPATGELALKVDSGSIQKPHVYFVFKGL